MNKFVTREEGVTYIGGKVDAMVIMPEGFHHVFQTTRSGEGYKHKRSKCFETSSNNTTIEQNV